MERQTAKNEPEVAPWLDTPNTRLTIAIFVACGLAAALCTKLLSGRGGLSDLILMVTIVGASTPFVASLVLQVLHAQFGVDILALVSIVTAFLLHQYWVAAIVVLMLSGGQALEAFATRRASSVLAALAQRMPQIAHRVGTAVADVQIEAIAVNDELVVYPHEICPTDGVVVSGQGHMDESYLTGEPFLIAKAPGATVLSGSINGDSALTIRASKRASDSRYAKILDVLHASEKDRPRMQRLGDRLGAWYTPLAIAIALVSWLVSGQSERFLAVLVIATPCPLLISIPVAIIGAISVGARSGIIIKDPSILETIDSCHVLFVDKTGTLTYGRPKLTQVQALGEFPEREILQYAASLEHYSKHPLASSVLSAADTRQIPLLAVTDISEPPGAGLSGHILLHAVTLTGRTRLPFRLAERLPAITAGLECILLVDGELAGMLHFRDEPRRESKSFLDHLMTTHSFREIVLLSGDRPAEVALFAAGMGIVEAHGGASPEEKLALVREKTQGARTLYLGDGINDAPAMTAATAGIAFGVNSDITSEAAGAVILQSSLESVDELIHIARRMKRIALTSAVGGMGLSLMGMAAAVQGIINPVQGAIAQEVIDLLAILNSLRMILPTGTLSDFHADASPQPPERHTAATAVLNDR